MRVCLPISARLKLHKLRFFAKQTWRCRPGLAYFSLWSIALAFYIVIGLVSFAPAEAAIFPDQPTSSHLSAPAEAASSQISGHLSIPAIGLEAPVSVTTIAQNEFRVPDQSVGSFSSSDNKTLLLGHSTSIFKNLQNLQPGDSLTYNAETYTIDHLDILPKSDISMSQILESAQKPTLILMTCAGQLYDNGDSSHRLIVTAVQSSAT